MLIYNVVGARPNFLKMAPVIVAVKAWGIPQILVHTCQHYDSAMSQVFFDELGLPNPDIFVDVGSDTRARRTEKITTSFDEVSEPCQSSLGIVAGDVNSAVACALAPTRRDIPIAHVEARLRSFERTMSDVITTAGLG